MTTEETNTPPNDTIEDNWGARFAKARQGLHLSEKDAASRLHLKPNIITIIETENFKDGPPAIFMRGYIRSYGRMLNLSEKEIAQALAQMDLDNPAASTTYVPQPRMEQRIHSNNNNSHVGWSTAFVVLGLAGLVGMWWWNTHNHNLETLPDATPSAAQVAVNATATPDNNPALTSTPNNITASTNSIAAGTTPPVAPTTQETAAPTTTTDKAATATPTTAAAAPTPATTQAAGTAAPTPGMATTGTPEAAATKPVIAEPSLPSLEEDEADANATPPVKPHREKTPEMANAQMSVPEAGLDDAPGDSD